MSNDLENLVFSKISEKQRNEFEKAYEKAKADNNPKPVIFTEWNRRMLPEEQRKQEINRLAKETTSEVIEQIEKESRQEAIRNNPEFRKMKNELEKTRNEKNVLQAQKLFGHFEANQILERKKREWLLEHYERKS